MGNIKTLITQPTITPPRPYGNNNDNFSVVLNQTLPWAYTITNDITASLSLFEELLYALIVFITELPPPPTSDIVDHTRQAKEILRRKVLHCLVSGAKTHSELAEVHHVWSLRDNVRAVPLSLDLVCDDWIESRVLVYVSHTHTIHISHAHSQLVLGKEGKLINPDDATGAALEVAFQEVAKHRSSRGRLEPNK